MLKRIKQFFRRYLPFYKVAMLDFMAYRFQVLTWCFITALQVGCVVCLWMCLYSTVPEGELINGYSFQQMIVYIVFSNIYSFIVLMSATFENMSEDISKGNIETSFIKPISYRIKFIFYALGQVSVAMFLFGIPFFVIAYCVFTSIGFIVIENFFTLFFSVLLFFIMVILTILIFDSLNFFFGLFCFYTESSWGVNQLLLVVVSFLSGSTIPLSFFGTFGKILSFSPFAGLVSNPVRTLLMYDSYLTSFMNIGIAILWFVGFEIINHIFFSHASKKITIIGG